MLDNGAGIHASRLDALQRTLVRVNQGEQRQAAMADPSRRDHQLSGDVR
jgi:hypothetical protein